MSLKFNPLVHIGLERTSTSGAAVTEDGSITNPFTDLNVKKVPTGIYHLIKENRESVVTRTQTVDGVLTIDGVNTIL